MKSIRAFDIRDAAWEIVQRHWSYDGREENREARINYVLNHYRGLAEAALNR